MLQDQPKGLHNLEYTQLPLRHLPPIGLLLKENASPEGASSAATAKLLLFLPIFKLVSKRAFIVCSAQLTRSDVFREIAPHVLANCDITADCDITGGERLSRSYNNGIPIYNQLDDFL